MQPRCGSGQWMCACLWAKSVGLFERSRSAAACRLHPREDWHSRHGERGGRGIGRTKRWAHVKGHESQNKQRYAGEPGSTAACYRLQTKRWPERRLSPNLSRSLPLHDTLRDLAVKAKMTTLVVPSCMFAHPNSRYEVNAASAVYILTSNRPYNAFKLPTNPSQPSAS
jgi:hypothetical protein